MKTVELAVRMASDGVDAIASDFDAVGSSARAMGDDVAAGSRQADAAAGRFADSADNMGSSASQAAGGLGDLGGALALMPGPLGAVGSGMEAVAPLVMGVTGATDLLNLAAKSNIVLSVRQRAAMVAQAVATRAVNLATRAYAAGQWALNAAMYANPIGAVVIAVAALVAGIVIAYKRSETFRNIVQGAMRGVQAAFGWVVDKVETLVRWVRDTLPDAWETAKDKVVGAASWIKDKVVDYFDAMLQPIQWVIDKVDKLVDAIGSIDFPDLPDLPNPFGRTAATGIGTGLPATGTPTTVNVNLTLSGYGFIGDENTLATALAGIFARYFTRLGIQVPSWPNVIGVGT